MSSQDSPSAVAVPQLDSTQNGDRAAAAPPSLSLRWEHVNLTVRVDKLSSREKLKHPLAFVRPPKKTRTLLDNSSGEVKPGTVCCIMGPSGAGKSMLLNALSGRLPVGQHGEMRLSGRVTVGDHSVNSTEARTHMALVTQADHQFAHFSVRETFLYAARLRLPKSIGRKARVEEIIDLLELRDCQHTKVGGGQSKVRGISGGQRRRVSIGLQLIVNPSVLLLDEPTSGLDSTAAESIFRVLRRLARAGRTVVCTIHQPSSKLFSMFDQLLLLCKGQTIFYGDARLAVPFFTTLGAPCPSLMNPAEHLLDLAHGASNKNGDAADDESTSSKDSSSSKDKEPASSRRTELIETGLRSEEELRATLALATMVSACRQLTAGKFKFTTPLPVGSAESLANGGAGDQPAALAADDDDRSVRADDEQGNGEQAEPSTGEKLQQWAAKAPKRTANWSLRQVHSKAYRTRWIEQFLWLTHRSFLAMVRDPTSFWIRIVQQVVIAIIIGIFWLQVGDGQTSVQDRQGLLFTVSLYVSMAACFDVLMLFMVERPIVAHERASKTYRLSAYFMARSVAELPLEIIQPLLFGTITYWMCGLQSKADIFFIYLAACVTSALCGQSLGLLLSSAIHNGSNLLAFANVLMMSFLFLSGFLINRDSMLPFLLPFHYADFMKYSLEIFFAIEFRGLDFRCPNDNELISSLIPTNSSNSTITAEQALEFVNSTLVNDLLTGSCVPDGRSFLRAYQMSNVNIWVNFVVLGGLTIVFRIIAYLFLRFRRDKALT